MTGQSRAEPAALFLENAAPTMRYSRASTADGRPQRRSAAGSICPSRPTMPICAKATGSAKRTVIRRFSEASAITDRRDPSRVVHPVADILRARVLAIACGYEDADDLDHLRRDPGFKLTCARSQPCRALRTRRPYARWSG